MQLLHSLMHRPARGRRFGRFLCRLDAVGHDLQDPCSIRGISDLAMRAELTAAIAARRAADARASEAAAVAARADAHLRAAREEVSRIQAEQRAVESASTEDRARAISAALRAGSELPATPAVAAPSDSVALASAVAACRAIEAASADLFAECSAARGEAAAAAAVCRDIVDRIIAAAAALAAEWLAAVQLSWRLQDRLTGLARIGNGVLLSHDQQADLVNKIDRRKAAIATDPRMIERPNYDRYLEGLSAAEERLWLDYSRRLMSDPAAGFGEDPTQ